MAKKNKKHAITIVMSCMCDLCGQVAKVEPGKAHFYCEGFTFKNPLPGRLQPPPGRKGVWRKVEEKQESPAEQTSEQAA